MNRQLIICFIAAFLVFTGLVGFNYYRAQQKIRDVKASPQTLSLLSYPDTLKAGQTGTFIWNIDTAPDLYTGKTTIYWGHTASPSALTKNDSPEAVGYPYHEEDYWSGSFKLPDTFESSITFEKPQIIYFRAFARVGNEYLWSEEHSLEILPNH